MIKSEVLYQLFRCDIELRGVFETFLHYIICLGFGKDFFLEPGDNTFFSLRSDVFWSDRFSYHFPKRIIMILV